MLESGHFKRGIQYPVTSIQHRFTSINAYAIITRRFEAKLR